MAKTCGSCSLCCKILEIDDPALKKPAHVRCRFAKGHGCSIYAGRPKPCVDFECFWLRVETLPRRLKPSRCGFVMQEMPGGDGLVMFCQKGELLTFWRKPEAMEMISMMLKLSKVVLITDADRVAKFTLDGAARWQLVETQKQLGPNNLAYAAGPIRVVATGRLA